MAQNKKKISKSQKNRYNDIHRKIEAGEYELDTGASNIVTYTRLIATVWPE